MRNVRRVRVVVGVTVALGAMVGFGLRAQAQTTTAPTTSTTAHLTTTTARAATTTTKPAASSTTSTTRQAAPVRLAFQANPTQGAPGSVINVQSINECKGVGNFFVLLSIGSYRLGSGSADNVGNWKFSVTVPQIPPGNYGLAATCLISRNGVDENAGIYVGPQYTVLPGQGPPEPTTPASHTSDDKSDNTALIIGLVVASVVALAAIIWALTLRSKHRKAMAASRGAGAPPPPA